MLQKSRMYAYIPAKDLSRARKFYEGTLGLKAKEEYASGVIYEFGAGTGCFLYPTPNAGTSRASQAFWQVDDVERGIRHTRGEDAEEYRERRRCKNRLVQGQRGKCPSGEPAAVSNRVNGALRKTKRR